MSDTKNIAAQLAQRAAEVDTFLAECLNRHLHGTLTPAVLGEAMNYSLLAGGKRLRPVLCLTTAAMFGVPAEHAMPFAAGLEMIHTYSLIHDDLPCMDNDDLRRGLPTCHKKFDEGIALLAGDGLLTDAFHFMTDCGANLPADRVLAAVREAAFSAGTPGMVGGQMIDIECTGVDAVSLQTLQALHALKTGAMLRAACTTGAILGGADKDALAAVGAYGEYLGLAFQIVDDILDVVGDTATLGKNVGSDAAQGKTTYPTLVGLDKSRELAAQASRNATAALAGFSGPEAEFLAGLAHLLIHRVS